MKRFKTSAWLWLILPLFGILAAGTVLASSYAGRPIQPGRGSAPSAALLRVGEIAPDFDTTDLNGQRARLSDLRGAPVAVNFWATYCVPCRHELPALASAASRHERIGLTILAVNTQEDVETARPFWEGLGLSQVSSRLRPLLDLDGRVKRDYLVMALPTTIWLDAKGIVRAVHLGELDAEALDRYIMRVESQ